MVCSNCHYLILDQPEFAPASGSMLGMTFAKLSSHRTWAISTRQRLDIIRQLTIDVQG
jgi:hypothetical protein